MKALFMDFDGVIVDTEPAFFESMNEALAKKSLRIEDINGFVGASEYKYLRDNFPQLSEEEVQAVALECHSLYKKRFRRTKTFPGLMNLFLHCIEAKWKKYIVTGTPREYANSLLRNTHINQYFDAIIAKEDYSEPKPSPQCYQTALRKFELQPSEVIAVEDSIQGVKAATDAGIKTIVFNSNKLPVHLFNSELVVNNHQELIELLKSLRSPE